MNNTALLTAGLAAMMAGLLPVAPAQAAPRTWVASYGSGTTCSRSQPCAFFQLAHNATDAGGEINCIDAGDFGGADISKSITIDCGGTFGSAGTTGFSVNTAGVVLRLRNLSINGTGGIGNSSAGISFGNGTALIVENCTIAGPFALFSATSGISFRPTAFAQLLVTDTSFTNNGSGSSGGGIVVKPFPGGTAMAALSRVTVTKNVFGIIIDGTTSSGGINMTIADSVTGGNSQDGIVAVTTAGGAPIGVLVTNTKSINNVIGIRSIGPNVTVRVDGSKITGNGTGLYFSGGGALLSFGNNAVRANGTDGAFSGTVGLQ